MVSRRVDLRSDTVTKPTEAMGAAMATANVDDNVLGVDPTAFRLELEVSKITSKEAGLYVSSGTMGNLISVLVHCDIRGSEVILGDDSHVHIYENGGISTIGGVHPRPVKNNEDGTMDIDLIEAAIRDSKGELLYPTTSSGGRCLSVEYTDGLGELAKKHSLKLHINGARIFNASARVSVIWRALGVPVNRLVQAADSVSVCSSNKHRYLFQPLLLLTIPISSIDSVCVVCMSIKGSWCSGWISPCWFQKLIAKVKPNALLLKVSTIHETYAQTPVIFGFICATAFVALKENVEKLEGDHKKAKINVDIVEGSKFTAEQLYKNLKEHGVLVNRRGQSRIRIALHHQISSSDVQYTLSCFQQAFPVCKNKTATKLEIDTPTIR
ncbi:putative low-specificity L-threonine aldolase 1 [Hibiscus syriacus]|uniref:Low-specificity L-threonine aldolase 1 n=1 Tax=Hibiscus syriacus TaxID=106335 RepID=A0A6A2XYY0_HIBSY|nr:putative low-specificity L-threonine aldolase 1 [Hibiscus syriacus]